MKQYFIKTYGCQMNIADSERLAGVLEEAGYQDIRTSASSVEPISGTGYQDIRESGIILVNTCCVRESAENRALGFISSLKGLKKQKPNLIIGVCGCLPVEPGMDIKKRFPHVDLVFGPNQPEKLAEFLSSPRLPRTRFGVGGIKRGEGITALVTIIYGCNNFCSFCIVPYVRGRERSRPLQSILNEINNLDKNVYKEVILLGQNVNSYLPAEASAKAGQYGLANLLRAINHGKPRRLVSGGPQIERIRFLTSHPRDMTEEIIDAVAELPRVCEYFHLPLQSGDDKILKLMNRGYTADYYRSLVEKIRSKIPKAAITSDVVVGFPGETQVQFEATLNLIRELEFDSVNTAAYSLRPGTAAAKLPGHLPPEIKKERLQEVMKVVEEVAWKKNQKLVGKTVEVLVETTEPRGLVGRTRTNKIVKLLSDSNLQGRLVNVRITTAKSWVLYGEPESTKRREGKPCPTKK